MRTTFYSVQNVPNGQVSIMADWLRDEVKALREAGVDVLVSLLTPDEVRELDLGEEAECCYDQGIIYLSFPIPDRSVPPFSSLTFTFLEQLKVSLSEGKQIVFHCRQAALNQEQVVLNEICKETCENS